MGIEISNPFSKVADVVKEMVTDKDKQNELMFLIEQLVSEDYKNGLATKTSAWADALHKLGRQMHVIVVCICVTVMKIKGVDIDFETAALLAGTTGLYAIMKGRGK